MSGYVVARLAMRAVRNCPLKFQKRDVVRSSSSYFQQSVQLLCRSNVGKRVFGGSLWERTPGQGLTYYMYVYVARKEEEARKGLKLQREIEEEEAI